MQRSHTNTSPASHPAEGRNPSPDATFEHAVVQDHGIRRASRKRRIAYLTDSFSMGGVERCIEMYISHLDREKFDPVLICGSHPAIQLLVDQVEAVGASVLRTDLLAESRPSSIRDRIKGLTKLLQQQQIDILHIQVLGGTGGQIAVLAGRLAGIPVIVTTFHGVSSQRLSWRGRIVTRVLDRLVNRCITPSEHSRQLQIKMAGRRPDKVKTLLNAIDLAPYAHPIDTVQARRELDLPQRIPIIGTIGRLVPQKGIEYFLEMARLVRQDVSDVVFVIVGDGDDRTEYEAIVREHRMQDYIIFTGYRTEVAQYLAAMDIFVLASRFEPFGLVLAEAMMMEKAIVTTDVGGIPEVVDNGSTATVVDAGDARALARAVMRYLKRPDLRATHGKAGRERVLKQFTVDRMIGEMQDLYDHEANLAVGMGDDNIQGQSHLTDRISWRRLLSMLRQCISDELLEPTQPSNLSVGERRVIFRSTAAKLEDMLCDVSLVTDLSRMQVLNLCLPLLAGVQSRKDRAALAHHVMRLCPFPHMTPEVGAVKLLQMVSDYENAYAVTTKEASASAYGNQVAR